MNSWCDVCSRFVAVGTLVSDGVACSSIFCLWILCSHVCSVFYWLIGHALLMYCGVVSLRLHLPCFDVCWIFGVAGSGWYLCSMLKHMLQPATRIPPQPSHTETPTHIETRTHDQCGDTIEKSQALDDGCINVRHMLSIE